MQMKSIILVLLAVCTACAIFASCSGKSQKEITEVQDTTLTDVTHVDWASNAVIYEMNVRQYSKEGTFNKSLAVSSFPINTPYVSWAYKYKKLLLSLTVCSDCKYHVLQEIGKENYNSKKGNETNNTSKNSNNNQQINNTNKQNTLKWETKSFWALTQERSDED